MHWINEHFTNCSGIDQATRKPVRSCNRLPVPAPSLLNGAEATEPNHLSQSKEVIEFGPALGSLLKLVGVMRARIVE